MNSGSSSSSSSQTSRPLDRKIITYQGRIDGVLGYRYHDGITIIGDKASQYHLNGRTRSICQEYTSRITRMTIALGNVVGNILTELQNTLRVGVGPCTGRTDGRPHFLGPFDDVGGKGRDNTGIINAVFRRKIAQRQHFAIECQRSLPNSMRVTNIGVDLEIQK